MNNKPKESSKKLSDIVKEKFGGKRRSSKEPLEISLSDHDVIESDKGPDIAIAELDNVINSYHNKSSNSGGKILRINIIIDLLPRIETYAITWLVKFLYTPLYTWSDLMICFDSELFSQNFV